MGFLFGGSKSKQKSTPVDMTPPELKALRQPFAATLGMLLGGTPSSSGRGFSISTDPNRTDVLSGIPSYQGPLVAQMTPAEQAILQQLTQSSVGSGTNQDYLNRVIAGDFLSPANNPFMSPDTNPFLQQTMEFLGARTGANNPYLEQIIQAAQRPTLQGLEETLSRTLPGRFTAGGHFVQPQGSSAFDTAAAIASRGAADALSDIATKIGSAAFEQATNLGADAISRAGQIAGSLFDSERGRMNQAVQLGQQEIQSMIENLQAQALPRLIEQEGIDRGIKLFNDRINTLLQALSLAAGAPLQTIAGQSEGTSKSTGGLLPILFK